MSARGRSGLIPARDNGAEERGLDRDDQEQYGKIHPGFHLVSTSASSMRASGTAGRAITVWNAVASCFVTLTTVATGRPLG